MFPLSCAALDFTCTIRISQQQNNLLVLLARAHHF